MMKHNSGGGASNENHDNKKTIMSENEVFQWDKQFTNSETMRQLLLERNGNREIGSSFYIDIQGITWEHLSRLRCQYRRERLGIYDQINTQRSQGYDETKPLGDLIDLKPYLMKNLTRDVDNYYHFKFNAYMAHAGLTHFQLRHLLSAIEYKRKVLFIDYRNNLRSFDPVNQVTRSELQTMDRQEQPIISTLAGLKDLAILGSFRGDIIVKSLSQEQIYYNSKITTATNSITNHIQMVEAESGTIQAIIASNDTSVRFLSIEPSECKITKRFDFEFCVNHACITVDRKGKNAKLMAVLGDDHNVYILDHYSSPNTSKPLLVLPGHLDYCFAASWHPTNDNYLVTGSQDKTARIWDLRMPKQSVQLLGSCMGPVRNITFSNDGKYMAFSEPADFVHIYRADQFPVCGEQMIDLFGEISGISFSIVDEIDRDSLFVGIFDRSYSSILQFDRSRQRSVDFALI